MKNKTLSILMISFLTMGLSLLAPTFAQLQVKPQLIPSFDNENYADIMTERYLRNNSVIKKTADLETFKAITDDYAIDKYHAFYKREILENVDPLSLKVHQTTTSKNKGYMIDKNFVIYQGEIIPHADPKSFNLLGTAPGYPEPYHYSADKNHVFINNQLIEGAIPNSFIYHSSGHAKDENHIYHEATQLKNSDSKSFSFLKKLSRLHGTNNYGYAIDKNQVYYYPHILEGADPKTFEILTKTITKDANHVFHYQNELHIVKDPRSFVALLQHEFGPYTFKDQYRVYVLRINSFYIITDANPDHFTPLSSDTAPYEYGYGIDDKNVYYFDYSHQDGYAILTGLNPHTFQIYGPFITDGNIVYNKLNMSRYKSNVVENNENFAENRIPLDGFELIKEIDAATFEYLGGYYAMDKDRVYQGSGHKLEILGEKSLLNPRFIKSEDDRNSYIILSDICYTPYGVRLDECPAP